MIRTFSLRLRVARIYACLGLCCCVACDVYDSRLLDQRAQRRSIRAQDKEQDAGVVDASERADAADSCGDGVVGEGEACDIAIARGTAGACPDGCSGGSGCMRRELEGEACSARCIERELTDAVSGDGCCPDDADQHEDDDCPSRCGNGELEPGETCDPEATCPTADACKSEDACKPARFEGAADSCDARCERTEITSCQSDDGCCPAGCDRAQDGDCPMCPEGAPCPGQVQPMPPEPPPEPPFDCAGTHKGSVCRACTCSRCPDEIAACLADPDEGDAEDCQAAIDCSEAKRCVGIACLCGMASAEMCNSGPTGLCRDEWAAAAENASPSLIRIVAAVPTSTLNHAQRVIECRTRSCAEECGL